MHRCEFPRGKNGEKLALRGSGCHWKLTLPSSCCNNRSVGLSFFNAGRFDFFKKGGLVSAHRASFVRAYRFSLLIILIFSGCMLGLAQGQGASVHGTVVALAGSPVPQALVSIEGPTGGQAATTNMMGKYAVHGLNPGKYKVTISGSGYETFVVELSLTAGFDQEVDAVLMVPKAPPAPPAAEAPASETPQENGNNAKPAGAAPAQTATQDRARLNKARLHRHRLNKRRLPSRPLPW